MHDTIVQTIKISKKKKLITVNIFTINEACCFIPDGSDREKWCGYKKNPNNQQTTSKTEDVNQTNKLRKI